MQKEYYERKKNDPSFKCMMRACCRRRRARLCGIPGDHNARDVVRQWHRQNGECFWCGVRCGKSPDDFGAYNVDHLTPISRTEANPTNHPRNLVIACRTCNFSKGPKLPIEFKAYRLLIGCEKTYHYGSALSGWRSSLNAVA